MGRQLPYAFLERVKDEFLRTYNDRGKIAPAHSLDKAFGYGTQQELVNFFVYVYDAAQAAAPLLAGIHAGAPRGV